MDETVSATLAGRSLSRLLRGVREGQTYLITVRDRAVARLVPANTQDEQTLRRRAARRALLERTQSQPAVDIGHWTRDELYDRR